MSGADICAGPLWRGTPWPEALAKTGRRGSEGARFDLHAGRVTIINVDDRRKLRTRIPRAYQAEALRLARDLGHIPA
jgi:hypothetical protein